MDTASKGNGRKGIRMRELKTFIGYANEAARKIRKVNQLLCGAETLEGGGILDEIDTCIYYMLQMHLSPIIGEEVRSDKLLDIATEIMYADEEKIKEMEEVGIC